MQFDLEYNYYYPFYTMEKKGQKKYYYSEEVYMHLSDDTSIKFLLKYQNSKLIEVILDKINKKEHNVYSKKCIHLSYIDFSKKIKTFQNFLNKGLNSLSGFNNYHKINFFYEVYKFNTDFELSFGYSKLHLKKDIFNHKIIDGKKINVENQKTSISEEWDKINTIINTYESGFTYKEIPEAKFKDNLNDLFSRYIPYLKAPKKLFKKEYKP